MFQVEFNKVRSLIVLAAIVMQGVTASATPASSTPDTAVTASVRAQLKRMGAQRDSSFCYVVEGGTVQGVNADQPVKIASVMKLMTSFWALEKLGGPESRFTTKVYYQASNRELHIEGSRDPFFNRDRFYLLLSDLNEAGITSVNKITVDRNFLMNMDLYERPTNHAENHTSATLANVTKADLMDRFNSATWWSARSRDYAQIRRENQTPKLRASISFVAKDADVLPSNPLAGKPGVVVYEIKSAPLKNYLKKMNIISINPVADELFHALGGADDFREFLEAQYRMGDEANGVYSGSGLPLRGGVRHDTTMSCSAVVRLIRRMDLNLEQKFGMDLADITLIAGIDTDQDKTYNGSSSLVVKTGTVNGAKNLAGSLETANGDVYFGIFMQGRAANSGNRQVITNTFMSKYNTRRVNRTDFKFDQLDVPMQLRSRAAATAPRTTAPVEVRRN